MASRAQPAKTPVKRPPGSPSKSPSTKPTPTTSASASKTHQGIKSIEQARLQRRKEQAQLKQKLAALDPVEAQTIGYKYLMKRFCNEKLQGFIEAAGKPKRQGDDVSGNGERIKVCIRKRPFLSKESENKALFDIITMPGENHQLTYLHEPKSKLDQTPQLITHEFKFSHSFDETMSNRDVYQRAIQGMIKRVLTSGGKATVFAYGQTGSGKSYMVFGDGQPNGQEGVFQYTAREILDTYGHFHLSISFYEIYGPKIYDLLNNRQEVQFFEGNPGKNGTGPLMPDLMEQDVESVEDLMKYLKTASKYRSTSATDANEQSSRSHAIFNLNVRFNNDGDVKPSNRKDQKQGDLKPPHASVSIIDLAGSEKASEANVKDQKLKIESGEINKSLLALKECIRALQDNNTQHVPFRQSKLTMVLRDSLEASSDSQEGLKEVVMVATIRPTNQVAEHTMNTLRYADRVQSFNGKQSERVVDTDVYSPMDLVRAKAASENHSSKPKQRHVDEMEEVVSTPKPSPNKTGTNPISKSESVAWSAASSAIADAHMAVLADLHALLKLEQEELVGSDVLDSSDYMEYLRRLDAFAEQKAELIKNFQARVRNEMNESK